MRATHRIIDYGDVGMSVGPNAIPTMIAKTFEHADRIYASGARLLTLGGDHTIPYGPARAAKKHHGHVALVHFDSHQDSLSGEDGRETFHGTFAHDRAAEGTVDATRSTQVFIRTDEGADLRVNTGSGCRTDGLACNARPMMVSLRRRTGGSC